VSVETGQVHYDMHGNVYEWVQDDYVSSYRGAPTDGSAWTTGAVRRVLRGGSWYDSCSGNCRAAFRNNASPGNRSYYYGFRLARTVL
jgi:formylglycine-generating enzyme required for sulfatase activity